MIVIAALFAIGVGLHAARRKNPGRELQTTSPPRHDYRQPANFSNPPSSQPQSPLKRWQETKHAEAIKLGEAETKRQLELYFGTPDGKPPAAKVRKQGKRKKR